MGRIYVSSERDRKTTGLKTNLCLAGEWDWNQYLDPQLAAMTTTTHTPNCELPCVLTVSLINLQDLQDMDYICLPCCTLLTTCRLSHRDKGHIEENVPLCIYSTYQSNTLIMSTAPWCHSSQNTRNWKIKEKNRPKGVNSMFSRSDHQARQRKWNWTGVGRGLQAGWRKKRCMMEGDNEGGSWTTLTRLLPSVS